MTDEEKELKELEEKTKQYKYEIEENKKKMETLYNDTHKTKKKKTITLKINRTLGVLMYVYIAVWILFLVGGVAFGITNYFKQLQAYDIVNKIEEIYDVNLKVISREAQPRYIKYKVKPTKLKFREIEFSIVAKGTTSPQTDIGDKYLKHIVERTKSKENKKEILEGFKVQESYTEDGLLQYYLTYPEDGIDTGKIEQLKNHILKYDKSISRIIPIEQRIIVDNSEK
ncbi:MAG: hypothetical protein HFJ55_00780 [Clostridia bacterium]|jgi:hypothetical protein|nr:hypothetical protein [Clostridia bacterium]